ncbi:hypothetical protein J3U16_11775 [Gilliamella sp. B3023]|uniref:hypothetical protein n=1 Tax=Gilliamella sp. B3023 TaxID=2817987 RepID=UPI002269B863|nr:hypothetical protein [Gilliamella sp. B3023]MCX8675967.1 hypothetical protein [Gilliamella sp. B3023]
MAFFLPFSSHALTSQTTRNAIQGSVPYLTFDGGRTRAFNTDALLRIILSDGTQYTPSRNNSSITPIELPVPGQSFADIAMFVPTYTNSVALSTLIGSPNNYWGDDDGDKDVTITGTLNLSIVDKNNQTVSRNTVPEISRAPYRIILTSTNGSLTTRYGFPRSRTFSANNVTYYVNPKPAPVIRFASPSIREGSGVYRGPASIWNENMGFLVQSTEPSRYSSNFPTTGANNLYFDLVIEGSNQELYWAPVTRGGITATMTNSTSTSVHITLTGPIATQSQRNTNNPGRVTIPTLPQTFELVGRDRRGNPIVKYGFVLKQWFVTRGGGFYSFSNAKDWCDSIGYTLPKVKDFTNAKYGNLGATPSSSDNNYQRRIGAGFFTEWGSMYSYWHSTGFSHTWHWATHPYSSYQYIVSSTGGDVSWDTGIYPVLCVSP